MAAPLVRMESLQRVYSPHDRSPALERAEGTGKEAAAALSRGRSKQGHRLGGVASSTEKVDSAVIRSSGLWRRTKREPWGFKWRSSSWYITTVVTLGVATDALAYVRRIPPPSPKTKDKSLTPRGESENENENENARLTSPIHQAIVVPVLPYRLQALNYTNISALTSYLLLAYSAGIFVSIFPVAYFFHRYPYRRGPMIAAVLALELGLILFMLIQPYPVMVISRFIQGAASAVVWSVGFALICENVPEKNIGRQIGFATSGVSIGTTIAPPIGGALYSGLGWHAPFVFTIIICAVDLLMRLLVLEQKDVAQWLVPAVPVSPSTTLQSASTETSPIDGGERRDVSHSRSHSHSRSASRSRSREASEEAADRALGDVEPEPTQETDALPTSLTKSTNETSPTSTSTAKKSKEATSHPGPRELEPWEVLIALVKNKRGMTGFILTFIFGSVMGTIDPTLTLRLQSIWDKESDFVGLIYLAAAAPTFLTGPIVGALADKWGAEWFMASSLLCTLPWLPLMLLTGSLPGFIIFFALANLFLSCAMAPVGLEITMAARVTEGMSEIHQFAAMNIAFSVSSAVGAIVGGQMYDHLANGWAAVLWFCFAVTAAGIPFAFAWAGNQPLLDRLLRKGQTAPEAVDGDQQANGAGESVAEGTDGQGGVVSREEGSEGSAGVHETATR